GEWARQVRVREVLIPGIDAPRGGWWVGGGGNKTCWAAAAKGWGAPAIDAIREDAETHITTILYPPVAIRVLEQVAQRALGVDALQLQVVALANKRRVDLQATHEGPTPFFIRGTRGFKVREVTCTYGRCGEREATRRDGTPRGIKVKRVDLMPSTRDLGGTPSLVDAQIADD